MCNAPVASAAMDKSQGSCLLRPLAGRSAVGWALCWVSLGILPLSGFCLILWLILLFLIKTKNPPQSEAVPRASRTLLCSVSCSAEGTDRLLELRGWNPQLSSLNDPGLDLFLVHAPDLKPGWISLCPSQVLVRWDPVPRESENIGVPGTGLVCKGLASWKADISATFLEEQILLFPCFSILPTIITPYRGWSLGFNNLVQHIQVRLFSTELWKYLGLLGAAFTTVKEQHDLWTPVSHNSE